MGFTGRVSFDLVPTYIALSEACVRPLNWLSRTLLLTLVAFRATMLQTAAVKWSSIRKGPYGRRDSIKSRRGAACPRKEAPTLVEAIRSVRTRRRDSRLHIAGDGKPIIAATCGLGFNNDTSEIVTVNPQARRPLEWQGVLGT